MVVPLTDKQKRYLRQLNKTRQRFALDKPAPELKKTRDYVCPMKPGFVPRKPRGASHVLMGKTSREKLEARQQLRAAFFASV
jgi:hypothetical protein